MAIKTQATRYVPPSQDNGVRVIVRAGGGEDTVNHITDSTSFHGEILTTGWYTYELYSSYSENQEVIDGFRVTIGQEEIGMPIVNSSYYKTGYFFAEGDPITGVVGRVSSLYRGTSGNPVVAVIQPINMPTTASGLSGNLTTKRTPHDVLTNFQTRQVHCDLQLRPTRFLEGGIDLLRVPTPILVGTVAGQDPFRLKSRDLAYEGVPSTEKVSLLAGKYLVIRTSSGTVTTGGNFSEVSPTTIFRGEGVNYLSTFYVGGHVGNFIALVELTQTKDQLH